MCPVGQPDPTQSPFGRTPPDPVLFRRSTSFGITSTARDDLRAVDPIPVLRDRVCGIEGLLVYGLVDPERMADRLTMVSGRPVTTACLIERWREFSAGDRGETNNSWAENQSEDWLEDNPPF